MAYTHWSDVMGNYVNAQEVVRTYAQQRKFISLPGGGGISESLESWLERQSQELHGNDHRTEDWTRMAREIQTEAGPYENYA